MATIGIIGACEVGSHIARAAIASGYDVVIANSREPGTLSGLVAELGPSASASTAAGAAAAGDFVVVAVPLRLVNDTPVEALAGKAVIDTNNYMAWRDGNYPIVDSGEKTEHELRQEQLPVSKVVKAFTHIQTPRMVPLRRLTAGEFGLAPFRSGGHAEEAGDEGPLARHVVARNTAHLSLGEHRMASTPASVRRAVQKP